MIVGFGVVLTLSVRPISKELQSLATDVAAAVPAASASLAGPRLTAAPTIRAPEVRLAALPPTSPAPPVDPPVPPVALPALAPLPPPPRVVEAHPGDTASILLARAGVGSDDAQAAIRQLGTVWDPRALKPGQRISVRIDGERLLSLRLALAPGREVAVARDDRGGFVAEDQARPTHAVAVYGSGTIASTLSEAANHAGVPISVVEELIHGFSYDVDFQRDIRPDDRFTAVYERIYDEFDEPAGVGRLLYGELVLSGATLHIYRFAPEGGEPGFFTADGASVKKALLRTPVDGARITSGFGMRLHPILGYSRMHRGVDFGVPAGTPVYAAGDGVVTRAGWSGGYGNYIEIEHNKVYATGYGHLSSFARGLHEGEHVRQGEVIGYVGMTGLATGPHLHYEVHINGEQVNPQSIKMTAPTRLAGKALDGFRKARTAIDATLGDLRGSIPVARGKPEPGAEARRRSTAVAAAPSGRPNQPPTPP